MIRALAAAAALSLLVLAAADAVAAPDFTVRVDGKVLRKASGKLVLSLSEFELSGQGSVRLENRKTGESRSLPVSSAYRDLSYTGSLPPAQLDPIVESDWIPYVEWRIPDTKEALNRRLAEVHAEQNRLRRELGSALVEDGDPNVKVSSRVTLNKIEKFHRIGNAIAREILRLGASNPEANPFSIPVRVEVGFNPFGAPSAAMRRTPLEQVREVVYWEVHRILTQQFGVPDSVVDFVYEGPATVRRIAPVPGEAAANFLPYVVLSPLALDTAVYLTRQGTGEEATKYVRLKMFRDRFIKDRILLDAFVNEGSVVARDGRRLALTFVPPFLSPGETLSLELADGMEVPVVPVSVREVEGYSLTEPLAEEIASRVRPGMTVRRK